MSYQKNYQTHRMKLTYLRKQHSRSYIIWSTGFHRPGAIFIVVVEILLASYSCMICHKLAELQSPPEVHERQAQISHLLSWRNGRDESCCVQSIYSALFLVNVPLFAVHHEAVQFERPCVALFNLSATQMTGMDVGYCLRIRSHHLRWKVTRLSITTSRITISHIQHLSYELRLIKPTNC